MNINNIAVPVLLNFTLGNGNVPIKFFYKNPSAVAKKQGENTVVIQTPKGSEPVVLVVGQEKITVNPNSEIRLDLEKPRGESQDQLNVRFLQGSGAIENAPSVPGPGGSSNSQAGFSVRVSTPQGTVPIDTMATSNQMGVRATVTVGSEQSTISIEKGSVHGPDQVTASSGQTLTLGKTESSVSTTPPSVPRSPSSVAPANVTISVAPKTPINIPPPTLESILVGNASLPPPPKIVVDPGAVYFDPKPLGPSVPFVVPPPASIPNVTQPSGGNATLNVKVNLRPQ